LFLIFKYPTLQLRPYIKSWKTFAGITVVQMVYIWNLAMALLKITQLIC